MSQNPCGPRGPGPYCLSLIVSGTIEIPMGGRSQIGNYLLRARYRICQPLIGYALRSNLCYASVSHWFGLTWSLGVVNPGTMYYTTYCLAV